mgnify:CR=1 FL=1
MVHFLDVARLAYVLDLEEQLTIPKERIYATALLHDIGRHIQYEQEIPHSKAGVPIAEKILKDCGFEETERTEMLTAIARHGDKTAAAEKKSKRADLPGRQTKQKLFCLSGRKGM